MKIREKLSAVKKVCSSIKYYIKGKKIHTYVSLKSRVYGTNYFEGDNYIGANSVFANSYLGKMSYISTECKIINTKIGRYTSIAPGCKIVFGNHPTHTFVSTHPAFYSKIRLAGKCYAKNNLFEEVKYVDSKRKILVDIGSDVWIATDVTILAGIKIGDGAIICAGAVVTSDVPPYAIVGGVPAKVLKYRFTQEHINVLLEQRWWNEEETWIVENVDKFSDINEFIQLINTLKQQE